MLPPSSYLTLGVLVATSPMATAQEPTLADVLQQHVTARGGRAALAAGDYLVESTVHSTPVQRRRTFVRRRPFAVRMETRADGDEAATVHLCDGRHALRLRPDGQLTPLTGEHARLVLEAALVDGMQYLDVPSGGMRLIRGPSQALAMPPGLPPALHDRTPVWPVAVMLACGTEVRLYFDSVDGRLRGLANTSFQPQRNVRFGDWRVFGDMRLPTSRFENRGADRPTQSQIDRVEFGPIDPALFAALPPPPSGAPVDAGPLVYAPTEVPGASYLLVPAIGLDRRTQVTALFDTGAGRTYLDDRVADGLGLAVLSQRSVRGIAGGTHTSQRWLEALELPAWHFVQLEVGAVRLPLTIQDEFGGWPSVILGGELLHHGPVFDRQRGRLQLRGPTPAPIEGDAVLHVPLVGDPMQDLEQLEIEIDGHTVTAVLDSGMPVALRLRAEGLRQAGLPLDAAAWLARGAMPLETTGAGRNKATDLLVRLPSFRLGPVTFEQPWVQIALDDAGGAADYAAALGNGALSVFDRVGLDRGRRRLELEPGSLLVRGDDGWRAPTAGAFLGLRVYEPEPPMRLAGARLPIVVEVSAGSPAAAAGLRRGDLLHSIDGASCAVPLPANWRRRLWARAPVAIEFQRDDGDVQRAVLEP
jgi:hypothetical protein